MTQSTELVLAAILLTNIAMAASSRLMTCIQTIAIQGLLIGILPLAVWNWSAATPHIELLATSAVNVAVKFALLPALLAMAMRRAGVRRELEPFVGYSASVAFLLALVAGAFIVCEKLPFEPTAVSPLVMPVALATMGSGLFMIVARRKALTQVVGFLMFENGIAVFGAGMMLEYGLLVELGILLDVLVLVFIMGIAIFHISREFSHIDADRLNRLGDKPGRHKEAGKFES